MSDDEIDYTKFVEDLSKEIPRIIGNTNNDEITSEIGKGIGDIKNVADIIRSLDNNEEPIIVKICFGHATDEEIDDWLISQSIPLENKDAVMPFLIDSFTQGYQGLIPDNTSLIDSISTLTKKINNDQPKLNPQSSENILNRIDNILYDIDTIKEDVLDIREIIIQSINPVDNDTINIFVPCQ